MTVCPKCKQTYNTYHKCLYREQRISSLMNAFHNRWKGKSQLSRHYQRAWRAYLRQIEEIKNNQN